MKRFFLIVCIVGLFFTSKAFAAPTVTVVGKVINISGTIDADWDYTTTFTSARYTAGLSIQSIQFVPAAAADKCVFKDLDDSGVVVFYHKAVDDSASGIRYFSRDMKIRLYLDQSEGTFTAGSYIIITLY